MKLPYYAMPALAALAFLTPPLSARADTVFTTIDLTPSGYTYTQANGAEGTDGASNGVQVGTGVSSASGTLHALLWSGTAGSAVDLNPTNLSGFTFSGANGASGGTQVGYGDGPATGPADTFTPHALLWQGTAASAIDLNPAGYTQSVAYATAGNVQVGYGTIAGVSQALLWTGTASSAEDLNQFLPVGYTGAEALGVDASGDVVGYGIGSDGQDHPLLWVPQASAAPEPSQWSMLEMIGLGLGGLIWGGCRKTRMSRGCDNP